MKWTRTLKRALNIALASSFALYSPMTFSQNSGSAPMNVYSVQNALLNQIMQAKLGDIVHFPSNGYLYSGRYAGLHLSTTGESCQSLSPVCRPAVAGEQIIGKLEDGANPPVKIIPSARSGQVDGAEVNSSGNGPGIQVNGSQAQGGGPGAGNSAGTGSGSTSGPATPGSPSSEAFGNAVTAAVGAGIAEGVYTYLIAPGVNATQNAIAEKVQQLQVEVWRGEQLKLLAQSEVQNLGQAIQSVNKSLDAWQPGFANLGVSEKVLLQKSISNLDSSFQVRAEKVFDRLEVAPNPNTEKFNETRKLGYASLKASIESRTEGLVEISDSQIKMAETLADFLYGLDPITGLHRDAFEFFVGKNLITGDPLSNLERGISGAGLALSMVSFGFASSISTSLKSALRIAEHYKPAKLLRFFDITDKAAQISNRMHAFGLGRLDQIKSGIRYLRESARKGFFKSVQETELFLQEGVAAGKVIKRTRLAEELIRKPFDPQTMSWFKKDFKVGLLEAKKIYPGNTSKAIVIGRNMGNAEKQGVIHYVQSLKQEGFDAHFFSPDIEATKELTNEAKNLGRMLNLEELKKTQAYAQNEKWLRGHISNPNQRATVIDLGNPHKMQTRSPFYDDLEQTILQEVFNP